MIKIDTSPIVGSLGMSGQAGPLEHLMAADSENLLAALQTIAGKPLVTSKLYILYGGVNSTPGGTTFTISAGCAAYIDATYGLQIFQFPAVTLTTSGNTVVATKVKSQYIAVDAGSFKKGDPVTFTDTSTKNVLNIFTIAFAIGASGSGFSAATDTDYANVDFVTFCDGWHTVGAAGEPIFNVAGTWANIGGGNQVAQFKKIGNHVYVRGALTNGNLNGIVFQLPTGYTPQQIQWFPNVLPDGVCRIFVFVDGTIEIGAVSLGTDTTSVPFTFDFFVD